jgi:hypothetical protein
MALTNPSHPNKHHLPTLSSASDLSPQSPLQSTYLHNISITEPSPAADLSTSTISTTATSDKHSHRHRQSISTTKANRTGLFTLAALARDRTTSAIASFTDPTIRTRSSSGNLSRQTTTPLSTPPLPSPQIGGTNLFENEDSKTKQENVEVQRGSRTDLSVNTTRRPKAPRISSPQRQSLLDTYPPSQSYEDADTTLPSPIHQITSQKMHQTSSRLLRMTDDERPFTRVCCKKRG